MNLGYFFRGELNVQQLQQLIKLVKLKISGVLILYLRCGVTILPFHDLQVIWLRVWIKLHVCGGGIQLLLK